MNNIKFYAFDACWSGFILGVSFLFMPAIANGQIDLGLQPVELTRVTIDLGAFGSIVGIGVGLYAGFPPAVTSVAIGICCAVFALGAAGLVQWLTNGAFEVSGWVLLVSFLLGNMAVLTRLFAPLRPSRR